MQTSIRDTLMLGRARICNRKRAVLRGGFFFLEVKVSEIHRYYDHHVEALDLSRLYT